MKSIVLKSLRQPTPSDETPFSKVATSRCLNLNPNLEFCIYSTCNLKSIKGFDFCYKHFKSFTGADEQNKAKVETYSPEPMLCQQSGQTLSGPVTESVLSEQGFLYKDLLRKESYQAHTNGDSSSEQDEDGGDEKMVRSRRIKRKDYDYHLSQAAVYSRNEIIKIFKSKIEKLDGLYKKQLAIINDNILISRKQFLTMKSTEQQSTSAKAVSPEIQPELAQQLLALKKYKKQSNLKVHLKKKFGKHSEQEADLDNNSHTCKYHNTLNEPHSKTQDTMKCSNHAIPLSSYCLQHILNESNQVLFYKCPGNPKDITNTCHRPLIESIRLNCPIHVSNQFIDSNLGNIPDELVQSDDTTADESMHAETTESDRSTTDSFIENTQQEEHEKQRIELDSMISNVKLISVIKEEQLDQEDTVI